MKCFLLFSSKLRLPYSVIGYAMSLGSKPQPQSWLSTFKKPADISAVAGLAQHIFEVSINNAEALKGFIHAENERQRQERKVLVVCEFLYLFMHLSDKWSFKVLGNEKRCKVHDQLYPLIVQSTIETIFMHWPPDMIDSLENEFRDRLNDAEIEYTDCQQIFDTEHPFSQNTLFSRFAARVCEVMGIEKTNPMISGGAFVHAYGSAFFKVLDLAGHSFVELNLPDTVRAIGKEI